MTIHVTIGEAEKRLGELAEAAARGEDVVLSLEGKPLARIASLLENEDQNRRKRAARRKAAIGMYAKAFEGYDLSLRTLKSDRSDPDERYRLKFGDLT